MLSPAYRI